MISLVAAVLALPTRGLPVPRLSHYALLSMLAVKENRARIQFELIETWLQDTRRAEAIAGGKARLLLIAAFTVVLGVLSLTVNWTLGVEPAVQRAYDGPVGITQSRTPEELTNVRADGSPPAERLARFDASGE